MPDHLKTSHFGWKDTSTYPKTKASRFVYQLVKPSAKDLFTKTTNGFGQESPLVNCEDGNASSVRSSVKKLHQFDSRFHIGSKDIIASFFIEISFTRGSPPT